MQMQSLYELQKAESDGGHMTLGLVSRSSEKVLDAATGEGGRFEASAKAAMA